MRIELFIDNYSHLVQYAKLMKSKLLILLASIFLIGNFHVVTDWCDDLSADKRGSVFQSVSQHDSDNDLCGHCGHSGLNILFIAIVSVDSDFIPSLSNPTNKFPSFISIALAPPTPPPMIIS